MRTPDWTLLDAPFPASDIEWRPLTVSRKTGKGLAAAYLTARAVAQRLDDVFGPGGWKNEYREAPGGGILCRIYFRDDRGPNGEPGEWIWREDGADRTDVEPTKGGLSAAFKRAGAALGIGRYLYDLPQQWVEVDEYGKFKSEPRIPSRFLPAAPPRSAERAPERPASDDRAPRDERSERVERDAAPVRASRDERPAGDGAASAPPRRPAAPRHPYAP